MTDGRFDAFMSYNHAADSTLAASVGRTRSVSKKPPSGTDIPSERSPAASTPGAASGSVIVAPCASDGPPLVKVAV